MGQDSEDNAVLKPKISGDLLLVVEMAQTFARLGAARAAMQPKRMILLLEAISLLLTGFYGKKDQGARKERINRLHLNIDALVGGFEDSGNKRGAVGIWRELYVIEMDLRQIWHDSGLQIGKGLEDGADGAEFN